uniref:Uncharacterized protein n=1 Tax=Peronospora matthiolae TaxID=2874970 RepID=A0AAV1VCN3_9STRA
MFHLDSNYQHKVFVNEPDFYLRRPMRGTINGVVTVLRSDLPRFDSAAEVTHLTVDGRYLVVRVIVEGLPQYLHNVYAPVDRQEKHKFFSSLATNEFVIRATHLGLGDLSTSLDPDSTRRLWTCVMT